MRRTSAIAFVLVIVGSLTGCVSMSSPAADTPAWKVGASAEVITAAPDAGGPLSYRNCPTLAEAKVAVPGLTSGPDANGVPFKTMILQCSYAMDERDIQGRPAGIGILVFDASAEGGHLWDSVRTDPHFANATDIPGLAEVAFATGTTGHHDVWVVQGPFGFHMGHTRRGEIPFDEMVALARSMLTGLAETAAIAVERDPEINPASGGISMAWWVRWRSRPVSSCERPRWVTRRHSPSSWRAIITIC